MNFKNNGPVLLFKTTIGIQTVSYHLFLRMAKMDMDWKLKKLGKLIHILMLCLQKSPEILLW